MTNPPMIVFSDLDGTLLDHDTYDHSPALPALQTLKTLGIPVILASSKTAAEIAPLRDIMGLERYPAIVENGSGVLETGKKIESSGAEYTQIRTALESIPQTLRVCFTGFGDLDDAGVAKLTGLPLPQAALARTRAFSEPGTWNGSDTERRRFEAALAEQGIASRYGGRYLTLSLGRTKADQMDAIAVRFGSPPRVALGDAPNDTEMLAASNYPILILNPHAKQLSDLPKKVAFALRRSTKTGPSGWNAEITRLLSELKLT